MPNIGSSSSYPASEEPALTASPRRFTHPEILQPRFGPEAQNFTDCLDFLLLGCKHGGPLRLPNQKLAQPSERLWLS
jgi:hypothetical protein